MSRCEGRSGREIRTSRARRPLHNFALKRPEQSTHEVARIVPEQQKQRRRVRLNRLEDGERRLAGIARLPAITLDKRRSKRSDRFLIIGYLLRSMGHRAARPVGPERAWRNDRDLDAEMLDLLGERLRNSFQSELTAVVNSDARKGRQSTQQEKIEEVPCATLAHER